MVDVKLDVISVVLACMPHLGTSVFVRHDQPDRESTSDVDGEFEAREKNDVVDDVKKLQQG